MQSERSIRHIELNYLWSVIKILLKTETNMAHADMNSDYIRLRRIFSNYVVNSTIFGDKKNPLGIKRVFCIQLYLQMFNAGKNSAR
jgi:hypothetical protein